MSLESLLQAIMAWLDARLTLFALVVLVQLEALKGGGAGDQFVREFAFVVWVVVAAFGAVDLLSIVLRIIWRIGQVGSGDWGRER